MFDKRQRIQNAPSCVLGQTLRWLDGKESCCWSEARERGETVSTVKTLVNPIQRQTARGGADHLKLWVLKIASVQIDSFSFGKWIQGGLLKSQSTSQCVLENRDRDGTWGYRQAACKQSLPVCAFMPQGPGQPWAGRVAEPSGMFLPTEYPLKSDSPVTQKPCRKLQGALGKEASRSPTHFLIHCTNICGVHPSD